MNLKVAKKEKNTKKVLMRIVCLFIIVTISYLYINMTIMSKKLIKDIRYKKQIVDLEITQTNEKEKYKELIDRKNTINSNENVEQISREQFGFIKSDEIILKPNNK